MKRFTMIIGLISMLTSQMALGQTLTFQGVLRDPVGRTVEDGEYTLTVRLYEAEVEGEVLWSEVHPDVPIHHGVFSIELGSVHKLENVSFARQYWLGISVEDADEMFPRFKLTTAPSSLSIRGRNNLFPYTGNVGIGTLEPATNLYITGDGNNYITVNTNGNEPSGFAFDGGGTRKWALNLNPSDHTLNIQENGGSDAVTITSGGNVGVGTTTPAEELHIAGETGVTGLTVDGNIRISSNNGLWISDDRFIGSDGADLVGLKSGANWGLTIGSDGYAGIGTTTPDTTLEVNGDVKLSAGGSIIFSDGTALSTATVGGASNFLTNTDDAVITADDDGDGTGSIQFLTRNETRMTLTNDGLLGIGTDSPQNKLEIAGDINFSGQLLHNGLPFVSTPWDISGNDIFFNTGNVSIGTDTANYTLDVHGKINTSRGFLKSSPSMGGVTFLNPWQREIREADDDIQRIVSGSGSKIYIESSHTQYDEDRWNTADLIIWGGDAIFGYPGFSGDEQIKFRYNGTQPYVLGGGRIDIGNNNNTVYYLYVDRLHAFNWWSLSDSRVKKNMRSMSNSLDKILKLNGIKYDTDKGAELGFNTEDLKEVIPEMVKYDEEHDDYYINNPQQLLPVLVEALKELKAKNDALKKRAAAVRAELAEIKDQ